MPQSKAAVTKILLNFFHNGDVEMAKSYLPAAEAQAVANVPLSSDNIDFLTRPPQQWLQRMHYSWMDDSLKKIPEALHSSAVAALPEPQSSSVAQQKKLSSTALSSPLARAWYRHQLFEGLALCEAIPLEHVPDSPFKGLCSWSKSELVTLIDVLAMYDLVTKIRQIVDTTYLNRIYPALQKIQLEYLRLLIHQKDPIAAKGFSLEGWGGSAEELNHRLHSRGLMRLGRALTGQHEGLLWHLTHILDIGRAQVIMRHWRKGPPDEVCKALSKQVFDVIEFLQGRRNREF